VLKTSWCSWSPAMANRSLEFAVVAVRPCCTGTSNAPHSAWHAAWYLHSGRYSKRGLTTCLFWRRFGSDTKMDRSQPDNLFGSATKRARFWSVIGQRHIWGIASISGSPPEEESRDIAAWLVVIGRMQSRMWEETRKAKASGLYLLRLATTSSTITGSNGLSSH
jgi:hypothetical protein